MGRPFGKTESGYRFSYSPDYLVSPEPSAVSLSLPLRNEPYASRNSFQLAPAYDLVATTLLILGDTEESALALNGKKKNLRRKDFDALALSLGLAEKVRDNPYMSLGRSMDRWDASLEKGFLSGDLLSKYSPLMLDRARILDLNSRG